VRAAAQQVGSDVVITAGADAVTLIGVQLANLHSDDFLLS
jgi:NADPH:quinone reductase-like Zn-dependent oxidoreductase